MEWFEKALNEEGWMSRLGGEIQMWLALGYQARLHRTNLVIVRCARIECATHGTCRWLHITPGTCQHGGDLTCLGGCRRWAGMQTVSTCTKR